MSKAIHLDGTEYPYKVFASGIKIWLPDEKTMFISMSEFTGWTPDELDRASRKGYTPPIHPSAVKAWLEWRLRDDGSKWDFRPYNLW